MTTGQVVETSITVTNSSFQNYTHPDDPSRQTTDAPGFKPCTMNRFCFLFVTRLPAYASEFIEMCLMITADHGPGKWIHSKAQFSDEFLCRVYQIRLFIHRGVTFLLPTFVFVTAIGHFCHAIFSRVTHSCFRCA